MLVLEFYLGFIVGPVLNFVMWVKAIGIKEWIMFILACTERTIKMNDGVDLNEIHINFIEHA
jgi:hypothetical protein